MTNGVLLDSQVLMWLGSNRNRIGTRAMQLLKFKELFYSTVSIAELGYKTSLGKLNFGMADVEGWQRFGMNELPFGRQAALEFANVPAHLVPDPMDRQIVATARANNLALLTSDIRILELGFDWLLDATT